MCRVRLSTHPLVVVDTAANVALSIKFWWRFARLTVKIRTHIRLRDDCTVESSPHTRQRTYFTYLLTGEHSMVVHDVSHDWDGQWSWACTQLICAS